jgi:hypothetical protein
MANVRYLQGGVNNRASIKGSVKNSPGNGLDSGQKPEILGLNGFFVLVPGYRSAND